MTKQLATALRRGGRITGSASAVAVHLLDDTAMKKINIEVPPIGAYARWLLWVFAALTPGAVVGMAHRHGQ